MLEERYGHLCAVHDNYIYAVGGHSSVGLDSYRSWERIDLSSMTWEKLSRLPGSFYNGHAFSFQSSLYLISASGLVGRHDQEDQKWEKITDLGIIRDGTAYPAPLVTADVLGC